VNGGEVIHHVEKSMRVGVIETDFCLNQKCLIIFGLILIILNILFFWTVTRRKIKVVINADK